MNKKKRNIAIVALSIVGVIILVWGVAFSLSKSSENTPVKNNTEQSQNDSTSIDEKREAALAAVESILQESQKNPSNQTIDERTAKIEEQDFSGISDKLKNSIRFVDTYAESETMQASTYQAIINFGEVLKDNSKAPDLSWKNVFVDDETGIAYVPLKIFKEDVGLFYFEMVEIDGEWKLLPNSMINSVLLSYAVAINQDNSSVTQ